MIIEQADYAEPIEAAGKNNPMIAFIQDWREIDKKYFACINMITLIERGLITQLINTAHRKGSRKLKINKA